MGSETAVNRTNMGPFYEAEKKKLGLESQDETRKPVGPIPIPAEFGTIHTAFDGQDPQTAEQFNASRTGKIEEIIEQVQKFPDVEPVVETTPAQQVDPEYLAEVKKLYEEAGFKPQGDTEFQKRVIFAFKHLGLDTKKFFGV